MVEIKEEGHSLQGPRAGGFVKQASFRLSSRATLIRSRGWRGDRPKGCLVKFTKS